MQRTDRPADEPDASLHPLEVPFVWLSLQVLEWAVVSLLLRWLLPRDWPFGVYVGIWVALLIGLSVLNYRIRRRFLPPH